MIKVEIDQVINGGCFTSYYCNETKTPLFVVYVLYQGGGKTSRKGLVFEEGGIKPTASEKDYYEKGYDIGHMADAKDFSNDKQKEKSTFMFYNALPQTPKLNRGAWKELETSARKLSQTNHLTIICGGFEFDTEIGNVGVPAWCFKIIRNNDANEIKTYLFPNDESDSMQEIKIEDLYDKITFSDKIKEILNQDKKLIIN